jgi:hypothetical protein
MTPLLIKTQDAICLLGGASGLWKQALAAGWINPAVRGKGKYNYYRYRDIEALAERFSREFPPPTASQQRSRSRAKQRN